MRRLACLSLLLAACKQDYEYVKWEGVDIFYQNPTSAVDVLLVVDDSGSMETYQQQLGANFEGFLTYFLEADVDYQIAAVTTDVSTEDAGHILGTIIRPDTADAAAEFAEVVAVGTGGSGIERGLEAARLALTEPLVSTVNFGFLRADAALSLIFVSDEEDSSPLPVNDYINAFRGIKGQRQRDAFNASALCVYDLDTCAGIPNISRESVRYPDVAAQTGGVLGDICSQDFGSIVTELSMNSSRLRDTFFLSEEPDASTLEVAVEDALKPCEDGEWAYVRATDDSGTERPAVVFAHEFLPPVNSQIAVRYYHGGGDPSNFCGGAAQGR